MQKILILVLSLLNTVTFANEIYAIKDETGATYFSANPPKDPNHTIEKVESYKSSPLLDWNINCTKDKFNGKKICSLSKYHSDLMVNIINGKYSVYIGRDHYPNSQSAIKIDENTPIYGDEGLSQTPQKAIEQMKKGKVAYTRYKEWPYEYNQDGETDLTGFSEKFSEMLENYKKL
ncbi:hypothetical protein [Acinetobacter tandoii]|uniref:DUF4124 domain-containing protein n=1 Tax=Acinetobacter tandoii DSM 14970 = CIP 107469 TaxID=1120927 RepID=R9AW71_9GAMM|nr:hypothetical protein [Acinetobacter tandoii]EOR06443.1 hypothetical protein I593_02310 [Acinetobacter tandoii DSM 14970 = CIP 107469]